MTRMAECCKSFVRRGHVSRRSLVWLAVLIGVVVVSGVGGAGAASLGQVTEFSSGLNTGSLPDGVAAGADGNVWFGDRGATPAVGRITPGGTITEFTSGLNQGSIPGGSAQFGSLSVGGIVAGADGNVWFTDHGVTPAIGRITPSGAITEFNLPAGRVPYKITLGPDGNVWFTDRGAPAKIGTLTPSGAVTEFGGLSTGSIPAGITAGPDGNVWFTDQGTAPAVGRITLGGAITEFGLPAGSSPTSIATGPDGNLWFTPRGTPKAIGRITPSGTITQFASGLNTGSGPDGIVAGPDGNLWFIDKGTTKAIGRITPGGTITEFSLPAGSAPQKIALGSDGNLWFNDNGTTQAMLQFGVGAPAASVTAPSVSGSGGVGTVQSCGGDVWSSWAGQQPSNTAYGFDGYQWLLDGSPIAGATGPSYTPPVAAANLGQQLSCTATVTYTLLHVTVSSTSAAVTLVDLTAPVLSLPGPIVVDATGPGGAIVSYTATATDNVGTSPVVSCVPLSGSTFVIGTTTVNCTATAPYIPTGHASFTVEVKGASEQLADLDATVAGVGPGASLTTKIRNAKDSLSQNDQNGICGMLGAFTNEVNAQTGKKVTDPVALVAAATQIEALLGC